jgi:hypothetical protein
MPIMTTPNRPRRLDIPPPPIALRYWIPLLAASLAFAVGASVCGCG